MKKRMSFILAACLAMSACAGISVNAEEGFVHDENLNEVGTEPIAKEKVTLTIGVRQNANIEDYETNWLTQMIEEAANVDLEFVEYVADEWEQKVRLQMAAGGEELPDILQFNGMSDTLVSELANADMIISLDEYYDNCSVYYNAGFEHAKEVSNVDVRQQITFTDGHVYSIPSYCETYTNPPYARMWVYTPWLETLGLKEPETLEEFHDMLVAFKTQDPNGNGIADEIPLLGSESGIGFAFIDYILGAFGVSANSNSGYRNVEDGQVNVSYVQEGYKEGIAYIQGLVEEGLIEAVSFSQDQEAFKTIMNAEGDHLVGAFGYISPAFITDAEEKNNWTLLSPLPSEDGTTIIAYTSDKANNAAVITTNCEYPELAFRVLDLFAREDMTITNRWGKEGENWNYVEDLKDNEEFADMDFSQTFGGYPAYFYEYNNVFNQVQNNQWQNTAPAFRTKEIVSGWYACQIGQGTYNDRIAQKIEAYEAAKPAEVLGKLRFTDDVNAEVTELENTLLEYAKEKKALWCTGASDITADWDAYLNDLESMGLSRYLELYQEAYEASK